MREKEIMKTDTKRYKDDAYLHVDMMCRKLCYTILNNFRSRPTEENLERIENIVRVTYKAIKGELAIKFNTQGVSTAENKVVIEEVPRSERPIEDGPTGDGCPKGEHWNGSACEPDTVTP